MDRIVEAMRKCRHRNAIPQMVGKWCPDCGAWKGAGKFSDDDGCVWDTGARWERPYLVSKEPADDRAE